MTISNDQYSGKSLIYLFLVFTGIIVLRNAWVGDDAYIAFRTAYNFTHGYGLRFNINERVQSFTNPLWTLLMSFCYLFTREAYFTTIFLSLIVTLIALYFLSTRLSGDNLTTAIIFALACTSKAFIDYSTSGLENCLGHMFIVFFAIVYLSDTENKKKIFLLFFIASLAAVNRLDNLILYIIPLLVQLKYFSRKNMIMMVAGLSPLIIWELFSLIYYGFVFPNTYYVKLNTGISGKILAFQGMEYLLNSIDLDAITLITIFLSVLFSFHYSFKNKNYKLIPLTLSVPLYLAYVVKVGGDFMSGRFLTCIFLISLILIAQIKIHQQTQKIFLGLILIFAFATPYSPIKSNSQYRVNNNQYGDVVSNDGISDERGFFYPYTGLMKYIYHLEIRRVEKDLDTVNNSKRSISSFQILPVGLGFPAYTMGPHAYVFHEMGLTDPLVARLPKIEGSNDYWRIGHTLRKIPEGYVETLRTDSNQIKDKNLALFYDHVSLIIRGDIFSWKRFETIIQMNMGKYDYLIAKKY